MAYPYLPVNPCCTEVVLNDPCGCSSTITNGGCNNPCGTNLTASSTIVYDGPALSCTTAEPCDTLNVILQKIDEIICNLLTQINILNIQINNINNQILIIEGDIFNIYNQLGECCTTTTSTSSSSTTTSTTTIHPCEQFSLNNTGVDPVAIIITDCTTQDPEAIILMPGDTNICVVTDSPLTVPGTVIVTPNGPCIPPTSSTTTTTSSSTSTSTSSTTTTTTTAIPCECLTFYNGSRATQEIIYIDCNGETQFDLIDIGATNSYCGCCGEAATPDVTISIGADCVGGLCPEISTSTTTTTTTAYVLACTAGYTGPVGFPNRTTGNGTMTLGSGLVINTTYTGPALLTGFQPPYSNCVGGQLAGNVGIGGTISLNYNGGAFTFTITYSTPQTAVKFVLAGIGYADQLGISEYYTVTTSAANTVVNLIDGCGDFRVEAPNVVAGSMQNPINNIGGNIEVVADAPFTTITITGNNSASLAGTGWDMYICDAESTTTTTSSSSTSTTTSSSTSTTTSTSSTTTTTTTAFVGACTCMTVTIAQTDLDDATGNTTPGIFNNAVELRTTKSSSCDGSDIDRTYTDALSEGWCIKTASISTIQMFYYKNNAPIYLPAIDSTYTILYSACTLNGDCEITTTTTTTVEPTTTTTTLPPA